MKIRAILVATLVLLGTFTSAVCQVQAIEIDGFDIFDNGAAGEAEGVQIVNGRVVLTGTTAKKTDKPAQPDPAGEQVLELTDGSQLHGRLTTLGKSELIWQRGDTTEPLTFSPQDVRRIVFAGQPDAQAAKANATIKLNGSDWLTGDLVGMQGGKFRLAIPGAGDIEIERGKIEWLYLSKTTPPDAYEGPTGPMGLAGWDTGGSGGSGAWDYADGALAARAAMPLTRRFEALSDRMDIEFSASDGGNAIRGLTLWLQPGLTSRGYSKGSVYLRFQANNITANSYDGSNMKNFSAVVPEDKNPPKETRYRILQDRRSGKLVIFVNGKKVADWDTQGQKESAQGGSLSWQPTYWSSNMAWTLSKVRVRPWDGNIEPDPKGDDATKDAVSAGAGRQAGSLEAIGTDSVRFSGKEMPRSEPLFIRLNPAAAGDPPAGAVARVWLAQRGEFDVTALGFRDGQLRMRTSFGGELALPVTALRSIEFPHRIAAGDKAIADGGDSLIFRNGDELRGTLVSATHDKSVKWKPVKAERPVEFAVSRLAGVLLASKAKPASGTATAAVRFRNGDWLPGELKLLDKAHLLLKSPIAEDLRLDRSGIRAIYFGRNSEVPVWDGASDRQSWMKATNSDGPFSSSSRQRKDDTVKRNPWRYLDGAFTLPQSSNRNGYGNGPNIGRALDNLPDKVEVSFDLSTPKGPAGYSIQLFNEENRPGLMIQGGWDSAYIYDMSPRKQGGAFFNQPQQIEFGEAIGSEGNRRQFRILADRRSGRLVMLVNGIPVGQFGQKPGKESAKPGKGISIVPQPMNSSVTVSNLWIGPWSGDAPDTPKRGATPNRRGANKGAAAALAEKPMSDTKDETKSKPVAPAPPAADLLALVNGDETSGTIESATATDLRLQCDVGKLDIPMNRALMAEFAGPVQPPATGVRLHLAGKGTITVDSLTVADGKVTCHSAAAGDLSFGADTLSEIVFQPRTLAPPENAADKKSGDASGNQPGGNVIIRGGGQLQIEGNVIINGGVLQVR